MTNCECGKVFGEGCSWDGKEKDLFLVEVSRDINNDITLVKAKNCTGNSEDRLKVSPECAKELVRYYDAILIIQFENWPEGHPSKSLFLGEARISNYEAVFRDYHMFITNNERMLDFSNFVKKVLVSLFNNFKVVH